MVNRVRSAIIASLYAACLAPGLSMAEDAALGDPSGSTSMVNMKGMHESSMQKAGGWMFGYRYTNMKMEDLIVGSDEVKPETALNNSLYTNAMGEMYTTAPTSMTTAMHELSAMYTYSEKMSVMVMLDHISNDMDMIMSMMPGDMPMQMSMESSGIGDTHVTGFYRLGGLVEGDLQLKLGLSLPTGSIDEKDGSSVMPYAMQLGSGTYDLSPGFIVSRDYQPWGVGAEGSFTLRLGDNGQNYNLGNRFALAGWVARNITPGTLVKAAVTYTRSDAIEGSDIRITDMMSISNDPRNYGGSRVDLALEIQHKLGHGHSVGFEYALPLSQDLNGIQMKTDQMLALSWNYALM